MARAISLTTAVFIASTTPLWADTWGLAPSGAKFERIGDRETFLSFVSDNALKRFGITLNVQPDGRIDGRAFGQRVTGEWQWRDGYFCRDMYWGSMSIGSNCQEVKVSGDMLRFTSDEGRGDFADLRLR